MKKSPIQVVTSDSIPFWRDERVIQGVIQGVSALLVIGALAFFIGNVLRAANARGLNLGYDFLDQAAGFPLGESAMLFWPAC